MKFAQEAAEKIYQVAFGRTHISPREDKEAEFAAIIETCYSSRSGEVDYTEEATRLSGSAILQLPTELMIPELVKVLQRICHANPSPDVKVSNEAVREAVLHAEHNHYLGIVQENLGNLRSLSERYGRKV